MALKTDCILNQDIFVFYPFIKNDLITYWFAGKRKLPGLTSGSEMAGNTVRRIGRYIGFLPVKKGGETKAFAIVDKQYLSGS